MNMTMENDDNLFEMNNGQKSLEGPTKEELTDLTMLRAIEGITSRSRDSHLSEEFLMTVKPFAEFLGERLNITDIQAVLFSLFVEESGWSAVSIDNLCGHLQCPRTTMLAHYADVDDMVSKRLLKRCSRLGSISYNVPLEVLKSLSENNGFVAKTYYRMTEEELFDTVMDLYETTSQSEMDDEALFLEIDAVMAANKDLPFVKTLSAYTKDKDLRTLIVYACGLYVSELNPRFDQTDIRTALKSSKSARAMARSLESGDNILLSDGLVVFDSSESFFDRGSYRLTNKGLKKFIPEHLSRRDASAKNEEDQSLVSFKKVTAKELYFNQDVDEQVCRLSGLLKPKSFKEVTANLRKSGLREGFACLFYGSPGTGKTETVYQLARKTGRDIFPINVERIKSMWVGQSEKNIKAVFEQYRQMCSDRKVQPILLFNEADSIFGNRRVGANSSVEKMENSIQNIILQEMESMKGILIATTNLTDNIDKAFERRFLYKIKFDKPEAAVRARIWQSQIPGLSYDVAFRLASEFDFSGGQIENISRIKTVDAVLRGVESLDYNTLREYCLNETLGRSGDVRKIGF